MGLTGAANYTLLLPLSFGLCSSCRYLLNESLFPKGCVVLEESSSWARRIRLILSVCVLLSVPPRAVTRHCAPVARVESERRPPEYGDRRESLGVRWLVRVPNLISLSARARAHGILCGVARFAKLALFCIVLRMFSHSGPSRTEISTRVHTCRNNLNYAAAEMQNPTRDLPRAICMLGDCWVRIGRFVFFRCSRQTCTLYELFPLSIPPKPDISLVLVIVSYCLVNLAYFAVLSADVVAATDTVGLVSSTRAALDFFSMAYGCSRRHAHARV